MCFTGGFALAMMTEPAVTAPVLSQPSFPIGGAKKKRAIGVSQPEISCARPRFADERLSMIGPRLTGDPLVPDERFDRYTCEFGDKFERWDIDPAEAKAHPSTERPHSVLTLNLKEDGATQAARQRVIEFFKTRTRAT